MEVSVDVVAKEVVILHIKRPIEKLLKAHVSKLAAEVEMSPIAVMLLVVAAEVLPEMTLHVAEHTVHVEAFEQIVKVEVEVAWFEVSFPLEVSIAHPVVIFLLGRVGQDFIGFRDFSKFIFRAFFFVFVRMIF